MRQRQELGDRLPAGLVCSCYPYPSHPSPPHHLPSDRPRAGSLRERHPTGGGEGRVVRGTGESHGSTLSFRLFLVPCDSPTSRLASVTQLTSVLRPSVRLLPSATRGDRREPRVRRKERQETNRDKSIRNLETAGFLRLGSGLSVGLSVYRSLPIPPTPRPLSLLTSSPSGEEGGMEEGTDRTDDRRDRRVRHGSEVHRESL